MIFAVLVASFDILLGYTGILSFGHVMFFGIGAYCVALLLGKFASPTYAYLLLGFVIAMIVTTALALLVAFCPSGFKPFFLPWSPWPLPNSPLSWPQN